MSTSLRSVAVLDVLFRPVFLDKNRSGRPPCHSGQMVIAREATRVVRPDRFVDRTK